MTACLLRLLHKTKKKGSQMNDIRNPLNCLVGQGGVEPPTLGFSVLKGQKINKFYALDRRSDFPLMTEKDLKF